MKLNCLEKLLTIWDTISDKLGRMAEKSKVWPTLLILVLQKNLKSLNQKEMESNKI